MALGIWFSLVTFLIWFPNAQSCSRVAVADEGAATLVGRTLDWVEDTATIGTAVYVHPRGLARDGLAASNSLKWISKYGSLSVLVYQGFVVEGVNEKGLNASVLYLDETAYGPRDEKRPGLAVSLWAQYYLDQFSTVAEAIAATRTESFQLLLVQPGVARKFDALLHLALTDASGDNAVIEYLEGVPVIHHDRKFTAVTNSPTYGRQLENLRTHEVERFARLPGASDPRSRFIRAAYYGQRLGPAHELRVRLAGMLSVMRNVSQPLAGKADVENLEFAPTYWRTVADLTHRTLYFESTLSPNLVWMNLDALPLAAGSAMRKIDLVEQADRLAGDIGAAFVETKAPPFLAPSAAAGGVSR